MVRLFREVKVFICSLIVREHKFCGGRDLRIFIAMPPATGTSSIKTSQKISNERMSKQINELLTKEKLWRLMTNDIE